MDDFTSKKYQKAFVERAHTDESLLQKELNVLYSEEVLLKQRIDLMKIFLNEIPSWDPQYSMILLALEMDQIEFEELESRKIALLGKFHQTKDN